jgi:hypothetical protein
MPMFTNMLVRTPVAIVNSRAMTARAMTLPLLVATLLTAVVHKRKHSP